MIESIEDYIFGEFSRLSDVTELALREAYELSVTDSSGTETLPTIRTFATRQFSDTTSQVQIRLYLRRSENITLSSWITFSRERKGDVRRQRIGNAAQKGFGEQHVLSLPIADSHEHVFAVAELANKHGNTRFDADDGHRLRELTASLALICETWWRMSCACRAGAALGHAPACGACSGGDTQEARPMPGNEVPNIPTPSTHLKPS